MKLSQLFTKTSKNAPADETAVNAKLLIQAGFIHKEMAGVYAYLPLGKLVLDNIAHIVREEMNAVGGQEVQMTVLQPRELFEKTNRWDDAVVDNWFKTKLANGTELGMGLTHEEPIVDVLKDFVSSYKDLPVSVYQIQSKFRNELRAKSGLLRGREFTMKDMYSFARSQEEHTEVYEKAAVAYAKVYERLGIGDITYRTYADGGYFTEKFSDEFQTRSEIGEDLVFHVPDTDLHFNQEVAPSRMSQPNPHQEPLELKEVAGEGVIGVEALLEQLHITIEQSTKTLFFVTDGNELVAAAVRSDYDVNELKLAKAIGCKSLRLADEVLVKQHTGAELGYAGLLHLPADISLYCDDSLEGLCNFETGANKTGYHAVNVNFERDVSKPERFYDFKEAKKGDSHPETGKAYEVFKACEVGNIFPLESKYTDALDLYYTDESGKQQSIIMGCYGIGISRLMGVIAQEFADNKGLVWPESIAPAKVYLARVGNEPEVIKQADELYELLTSSGTLVLYDDRDIRPGQKFADADLMGIPYRVVISPKLVESSTLEIKARRADESEVLPREDVIRRLTNKQRNSDQNNHANSPDKEQ